MNVNPFSRGRYEHIPTTLYYLPDGLIQKLEDSKPSYVIGSRGSGKTTLLKALSWRERLENKWLVRELGGDHFRGRFIASYTKLPLVQVNAFQSWLVDASDVQHDLLFGTYLDLVATENLTFAITELAYSDHFDVSFENEKAAVESFLKECDFLLCDNESSPSSLADCHSLIRLRRRELESCAVAEAQISETISSKTWPAVGEVARTFGKKIAVVLDECSNAVAEKWHFKCCFDEAECLSQRQLKFVNTVIRTTEWPISYVVSFVGKPDDLSLTSFQNLTTQQADLSVIPLDNLESRDFQNLCDGVGNIRVQVALENVETKGELEFKTEAVLGKLNMNELVGDMVKGSEGKFAKKLTRITEEFSKTDWFETFADQKPAPYIQAYLADRLSLQPPSSLPQTKREQASREFRKKFVAAFLSICGEMDRRKIPFAYSNMVFGISDNCVRDYLSQMHHIFEKAGLSVNDFLTRGVRWQQQDDAIHKASKEKRDSINTGEELSNPERVRRLTIAFGELTAILQQGESNKTNHLRSSERGIFHFGEPISPVGSDEVIYKILKDAADAGFLKLKQDGKKIVTFKVHASMAPAFGFSYRGAYYSVPLRKRDILDILDTTKPKELVKLSKAIASRLEGTAKDPGQATLFELEIAHELEGIEDEI